MSAGTITLTGIIGYLLFVALAWLVRRSLPPAGQHDYYRWMQQ